MSDTDTGTSEQPSQESQGEQQAVVAAAAGDVARKQAEADVEAYRAQVEQAPVGQESDDSEPLQSSGSAGTLKQWEDSPAGQAFIEASGGERQTKADDNRSSRRRRR